MLYHNLLYYTISYYTLVYSTLLYSAIIGRRSGAGPPTDIFLSSPNDRRMLRLRGPALEPA